MGPNEINNFDDTAPAWAIEKKKKLYNELPSKGKQEMRDSLKPYCEKYFESESYKSGKSDTFGYLYCCDLLGMCGMSGWIIFLIILIVLLCLAGAAAAFWFFYYKRKMGGRDEEKEIESTVDTANTGPDISVETY
ncbi:hypothetical protein GCK72_007778 [Caenorhabditis remanei]|uniref:Uncharacterized protein n=1 Tax=Caenorhabditis remanei TaxID=31234 RepID=A0A6A5HJZ2_CAERE|nr:hypothetical protein GCK72_007778 [Caenorhabditis remanei]KAF1767819.1 hypothetical protein GCK72_007778 [Caenorhabditis remanei]